MPGSSPSPGLASDHVALADDVSVSAEEIRSRAKEAVQVFLPLGDELGLARAFHMVGLAFWLESQVAAAEEAFVQAVSHAERAGDEREVRENLAWIVLAAVWGPIDVDAGLRRCAEIFDRARGNRQIQAFAKQSEGGLLAMRGDFEGARESIREGQDVLEDFGWIAEDAGLRQLAALVEMLAGDLGAAEEELRRGCEVLERMGELGIPVEPRGLLAIVLAREGRLGGGGSIHLHERRDGVGQRHLDTGAMANRSRGGAGSARRCGEAVQMADGAVEMANRTDALNDRADARRRTERCAPQGRPVPRGFRDARLALAEFERKGNVLSAGRVRELLDDLS